jgi:stage II sporulation protein AB (anti-sigma F factor)
MKKPFKIFKEGVKMYQNEMKLIIPSKSQNEAFARITVAAFAAQLDPTIEELSDVKTAVSEAVTNSIIHGYDNKEGTIEIKAEINENILTVVIEDFGMGIADVEAAKQPLYTSKPELERSGMGFTVMESFMDTLIVESTIDSGTKITMTKSFKAL